MDNWWTDLYTPEIAQLLLERQSVDELNATLVFLTAELALRPSSRVFDQCCGIGSIANPLASSGIDVIGVDQAAGYIQSARRAKSNARFEVGDCFEFRAEPACDAVINWWTSYGYGDDAQNLDMLRRAFESLVPGGRFALDTMNVPGVIRQFQRDVVLTRDTPEGELVLIRRSELDLVAGRMHKVWTTVTPDGRRIEATTSIRLTMPDKIAAQLGQAGFENLRFFGDIGGQPLQIDSPRCIVIADRPKP
ncbi:MAG: SAM-dependent methyltransferase [Myxococcota bacterium]|jgi:SAM-dependent methyltransferase